MTSTTARRMHSPNRNKSIVRAILSASAFFGAALVAPSSQAVEIDICEEIITEVLIPPIPQVTWECNYGFHCVVLPHCCVPGLCQLDPVCGAAQKIVGWTEAATEERVTFECRVENIDPKTELLNWLRGHAAAIDDAVLPFVKDVVRQEINLAKRSSVVIPPAVRDAIDTLTLPHRNAGTNKFRSIDIANARIISGNNALVSEYLREENGFAAITLGDLIVIRDDIFQVITNARNHSTAAQLQAGTANCDFRNAVLLLAHELVHVRQYADLGFDAFINNYLIEALIAGYGTDSFETEAYGYSRPSNPTVSTFGALIPNCSGTASSASGLTSSALTEAGRAAQSKLKACLDKKSAVPKACFEQVKSFYQVSDAERARFTSATNQPGKKLRQDYYFKNDNGRLLKVITNERLSREEVLKRLGTKPVFKPGPLVPPKLRKTQPPLKPMRLTPMIAPAPAPTPAPAPVTKPILAPTVKPKPAK